VFHFPRVPRIVVLFLFTSSVFGGSTSFINWTLPVPDESYQIIVSVTSCGRRPVSGGKSMPPPVTVSVIITVLNGRKWIEPCFDSICGQQAGSYRLEVCVFDDASSDETAEEVEVWRRTFEENGIKLVLVRSLVGHPLGG